MNKVLDVMKKNKKWNKFVNFMLLVGASIMITGGILSVIDGTSDYPAFRLIVDFIIFGLIVKIK